MCYSVNDFSTAMNPAVYTVSTSYQGYFGGTTLKAVLQSLWMDYNEVHLADPVTPLGEDADDDSELFVSNYLKKVTIKSRLCSSEVTTACLDKPSEIKLMSANLLIDLNFELELVGVVLEGAFSLMNDCETDACTYCPRLIESNGKYFDDKYNSYESKPDWPSCEQFEDRSFIQTEALLTLSNVTFRNFRQSYFSLIASVDSVVLKNVDFDNIKSAGVIGSSTISLKCADNESCSFTYTGGKVSRLNNGFELLEDTSLTGFLRVTGVNIVEISDVDFTYSTVFKGANAKNIESSLMFLDKCKETASILRVSFAALIVTSSLIQVNSIDVKYPQGQTTVQRAKILAATHLLASDIYVTNCVFNRLMQIEMAATLQNVHIETLTVQDTVCTDGLIEILHAFTLTTVEINGGMTDYLSGTHSTALRAPSFTIVAGLEIVRVYWKTAIIAGFNLANVSVSSVAVSESGTFKGNLSQFAYDWLKESDDLYITEKLDFINNSINCAFMFNLEESHTASFSDISISNFECQGVAGLNVANFVGKVPTKQLSLLNWTANTVLSSSYSCSVFKLTSMDLAQVVAESLHIERVYNALGGGVMFVSGGAFIMKDSTFIDVETNRAGGFELFLMSNVEIQGTSFDNITSQNAYGSCFSINFITEISHLTIKDSVFKRCVSFANNAGAIYVDLAPEGLYFALENSKFIENRSGISGAAVFLTSSIKFLGNSRIDSCEFTANHSNNNGTIMITNKVPLTLSNLKFTQNTGGKCIVCIQQDMEHVKVTMTSLEFFKNNSVSILYLEGINSANLFSLENIIFQDNQGYTLDVKLCTVYVKTLTLTGNSNPVTIDEGIVHATDLIATLNDSTESAGAVEVLTDSKFYCSVCRFIKNKGHTGAIIVSNNSLIEIETSTFEDNVSYDNASAVYIINSSMNNSIKDSAFLRNSVAGRGCVFIVSSYLALTRVVFKGNTSGIPESPGLLLQGSEIMARDCDFSDQTGNYGTFIRMSADSYAVITHASFRRGHAEMGGAISLISSTLYIDSCEISDISNIYGSTIDSVTNVQLTLLNTTISRVTAVDFPAAIYVNSGTLSMTEVTIDTFSLRALYADQMESIQLDRVIIKSEA